MIVYRHVCNVFDVFPWKDHEVILQFSKRMFDRDEQNGRHERMHLTLKKEATKPAAQNLLQQQERFDAFIDCFNHERPHQALEMRYPAELYAASAVGNEDYASWPTRSTTKPSP